MDREFVGHKWFHWLKDKSIPFCVRVPENHLILTPSYERVSAKEIMKDRKTEVLIQNAIIDHELLNTSLSYGKDGKLLYLIGNIPARQLKVSYKKKWSIEVFFQAIKERGFNLESSCLKSLIKYRLLFALVSAAYTICWATGIHDATERPVKRKKHGYPQFSVFRRGLNIVRSGLKNKHLEVLYQAVKLARDRLEFAGLKNVG
ncbi:MAG: transposase [Bacteroidales bacterium]